MVENVEFLNRLRNGHLEKSAVTGVRRPSRSPKTAKTPLKVHLRLRFQNLGKPRTAGLCGRAARISDCGPLSCAKIERPSPLEKPSCKVRLFVQNRSRKYRPKVTVTTLLQIAFHRVFQLLSQTPHVCFHGRKCVHTRLCSKDRTQRLTRRNRGLPSLDHSAALCRQRNTLYSATLLYTYISRFSVTPHYQQQFYLRPSFITFFNFSHKRPTFAFTSESGYTLAFAQRIAHSGLHAETGAVSDGGAITTLGAFHTFRKPCVARCQNGKLCRFCTLIRCAPEERRKPSEQRCAYARRCSEGVAAPLGCVIFFASAEIAVCTSCAQGFLRVRGMGGITTLSALCVLLKRRTAACQKGSFAAF